MTWRPEWKAIGARIAGLVKAGEFCIQCFPAGASDPFGVLKRELLPQSEAVFQELQSFLERYSRSLPIGAAAVLRDFLNRSQPIFRRGAANEPGNDRPLNLTQNRLTALVACAAEITYYLADTSASAKRLSDRAFIHLKRSIAADKSIQEKWTLAYGKGETECEKLGALHLLWHGLWAFKVNAEGQRTDLVLGERLLDFSEAERAAEALVLTEWKLVESPEAVREKAQQAHHQASLYSEGALAGFELADYRYLILVSKHQLATPPDFEEGGVRYCYINIAIDPEPPSRASKRRAMTEKPSRALKDSLDAR